MKNCFSITDFRNILLNGEPEVRGLFVSNFETEIFNFINLIFRTYKKLENFPKGLPKTKRHAWVDMFLFQAFNSLFTSFHLFISGYIIPSDHLMRQYSESISIALLFSHPGTNEFEKFIKDPGVYSFHKVMEKVKKKENARVLNINQEGWDEFIKNSKWFNRFSHPSIMTAASIQLFDQTGRKIFGAGFDYAKKKSYLKEIKLRQSAAERLNDTIEQVKKNLPVIR